VREAEDKRFYSCSSSTTGTSLPSLEKRVGVLVVVGGRKRSPGDLILSKSEVIVWCDVVLAPDLRPQPLFRWSFSGWFRRTVINSNQLAKNSLRCNVQ